MAAEFFLGMDRGVRSKALAATMLGAMLMLAACGGGDDEAAAQQQPPPGNPPPGGNQAPTISGSPQAQVLAGTQYSFTPTASDANAGDTLTFTIQGMPSWATFTSSNGRLSGTPTSAQVGTYSNIRIAVSDGTATTNLAAFSIQVVATATGSATLSWTPPTQNSDGSPIGSTLAGYRFYWGTSPGNYSNSRTVNQPGLSAYVIEQLTPGTWYFVATAYNTQGTESVFSNMTQKTIQ
jgi:hypothetical protein